MYYHIFFNESIAHTKLCWKIKNESLKIEISFFKKEIVRI